MLHMRTLHDSLCGDNRDIYATMEEGTVAIRRLRRDGNSLVVTIPPEVAGKVHLVEGSYVEVEADESTGALHIHPVPTRQTRARPDFIAICRQVIQEDRTLLQRLAAYD